MAKSRLTWKQRIAAAKKRGSFLESDMQKAAAWLSCAVGETYGKPVGKQLDDLKLGSGIGKDDVLGLIPQKVVDLGYSFYDAVNYDKPDKAAKILTRIQKMSKHHKTKKRSA